jgi:hypothetical protein
MRSAQLSGALARTRPTWIISMLGARARQIASVASGVADPSFHLLTLAFRRTRSRETGPDHHADHRLQRGERNRARR